MSKIILEEFCKIYSQLLKFVYEACFFFKKILVISYVLFTIFFSFACASACEHLVWSQAELPCDGQTVALLISAVENPKEFYCRINNPTGLVYLSSLYVIVSAT